MSNEKKLNQFTLILNNITGKEKLVDKAPDGFTIDMARLKTKFPSIAMSLTGVGVKLALTAKTDKKTGKAYVAQHRNECVQFQCHHGMKEVKHSFIPDDQRSTKGAKAQLTTFDLSYEVDGKPGPRCTNTVYRGKGDEFLSMPVCNDHRGKNAEGGSALPEDILGALGLDIADVS